MITREWVIEKLETENRLFQERLIGRCLIVLFNNQTNFEKKANCTNQNNNVGFNGRDGKSGVIGAKYYLKHGKLLDWQIEKWKKKDKNGIPRIAKYYKQFNEAAMRKNGY